MLTTRRVLPMAEFRWPEPDSGDAHLVPRSTAMASDVVYAPRARYDYTVRQAFLRSYHFSVRESFGDWLKRSIREAGETGAAAISDVFDRMFDGRLGMKVFRALSSMDPFRCFAPKHRSCIDDFL